MRIQLRRPAGEVQQFHVRGIEIVNHILNGLRIHDFFAPRPRIDMTMQALLITQISQIDLKSGYAITGDGRETGFLQQGQGL